MNTKHLSIATICWARDVDEETLLRKSLEELSKLGLPVYITDGGSNDTFVQYLKGLPNFTIVEATQNGLWAQANASLQHAANSAASFILYTEPDKLDFFKQLPQILSNLQPDEHTGIVLASRSAAGLATFPAFQQMSETTINNCCKELIGPEYDYTYGPFIISKQIIPYLQSLPDDIGWGWRPYAFNIAARSGLQIQSYTGDFFCPPGQRNDDAAERIYRMKQLAQNIQGLVLSAAAKMD